MIEAFDFIQACEESGIGFFTGVPDSLLTSLSAALDGAPASKHVIAVNEGAALALAVGYQLATGKLPLVYLQNSGLGNLVNPLTSLTDETVYAIPVVLLVGWRGQPGLPDEPQHEKMGAVTADLLDAMGIPVWYLEKDREDWETVLKEAAAGACKRSGPVAIIAGKGIFTEQSLPHKKKYDLSLAEVISKIGPAIGRQDIVVCTTGKIGRAFYAWNQRQKHQRRLLMNVGAMGHAGSLAASLALHSGETVWLFDGDGSLLMHLGALATNSRLAPASLRYFVLNNGAHESVGRQPTAGFDADFCGIAIHSGFMLALRIENKTELENWARKGPVDGEFVEIRINTVVPDDLPRPKEELRAVAEAFRQSFKKK